MKNPIFPCLILATMALAFISGCAPQPAAADKVLPATLEEVAGSDFKRVILTEKAANRITIQTVQVKEELVEHKLRLGGEVVTPLTADVSGSTGSKSVSYIRVQLTGGTQEVDRGKTASIIPLTGNSGTKIFNASSVDVSELFDDGEDQDDLEELYLEIDDDDYDLVVGERVFVDLPLTIGQLQRMVIPYAAVIYGVNGETWVYTNPEPLVFVRQPIVIDYIDGDVAYLIEGPAAGSTVVTMGVAELYGAETGVSK